MPFAPEIVIPALKSIMENYPYVIKNGRIPTGFNPSITEADGKAWVCDGYFGLDQGATVLMIENFRSAHVWNFMRKCSYLADGLRRASFREGWLS
jgi:hypothetical protein